MEECQFNNTFGHAASCVSQGRYDASTDEDIPKSESYSTGPAETSWVLRRMEQAVCNCGFLQRQTGIRVYALRTYSLLGQSRGRTYAVAVTAEGMPNGSKGDHQRHPDVLPALTADAFRPACGFVLCNVPSESTVSYLLSLVGGRVLQDPRRFADRKAARNWR